MENNSLYSPYKYMDGKQIEFYNTITGLGYNEAKAGVLFDFIIETTKLLEGCRNSRSITEDTLKKQKLKIQPPEWRVAELYLMQCLSCNSTYKYSYNLLAQAHWHETGIPLPINEITPLDLLDLIDVEVQNKKNDGRLSIDFTDKQLKYIFDEMVKNGNLKTSQRKRFLDICQGNNPTGVKLDWSGHKSLIRYFMKRLTKRDDIMPPEINNYVKPSIGYNDNHTGGSHYPIKRVFDSIV